MSPADRSRRLELAVPLVPERGGAAREARTEALLEPCQGEARALLVLAHGAGGSMRHATMTALAETLRRRRLDVLRFDFLYRALGKGPPDRMPALLACYRAVLELARERLEPPRLLLGGHSMGGRVASVLASEGRPCDGLVLLAYPLHPPGRPDRPRAEHLAAIEVPVLALSGTRDDFCRADVLEAEREQLPPRWHHHRLEGADHGYRVLARSGRTQSDVWEEIGVEVDRWLARLEAGAW